MSFLFNSMLDWYRNLSDESFMIGMLITAMITVVVVVMAILIDAGLFYTINVKTIIPNIEELTVMYKSGRGSYNHSGALFTEAHTLFPEYNTIGVYYDDPEKTRVDDLRYIVGLVMAEGREKPNEEHVQIMKENGFKQFIFPKNKGMVFAPFPFRNTLSCILSVFRVYPLLREYVEKKKLSAHPFIELYHSKNQHIYFMAPLKEQFSFYVPEVLEEPPLVASNEEDSYNEESCDDDSVNESSVRQEDSEAEQSESKATTTEGQWENSASIIDDGEESDTNTASSFEEIDPKETQQDQDSLDEE